MSFPHITSYTVSSTPPSAGTTVAGSTLSAVVAGLANDTPYTFAVTAYNAVGTSTPSLPSSSVTPAQNPAAVPGLTDWGMMALAGLFGVFLALRVRKTARAAQDILKPC